MRCAQQKCCVQAPPQDDSERRSARGDDRGGRGFFALEAEKLAKNRCRLDPSPRSARGDDSPAWHLHITPAMATEKRDFADVKLECCLEGVEVIHSRFGCSLLRFQD